MLPKALNLSCLSSERNSCFASNNPYHGEWPCWATTGLLNDWRQQVGAYFLNPSSWASAGTKSSEWEFLHIYNDYLGIFHHQNWISNVSHFTYLAITHLRCQLQTSQETVVLMEFCQQPKKVLKGLAEKRNHQRIIPNPAGKVTRLSLLPKCCYWGLININWTAKSVWHFTKTAFLSPAPLKMIMEIKVSRANRPSPLWHNIMKKSWCDYKGELLSTFRRQKINFVVIYPGPFLSLSLSLF